MTRIVIDVDGLGRADLDNALVTLPTLTDAIKRALDWLNAPHYGCEETRADHASEARQVLEVALRDANIPYTPTLPY